MKIGIVTVYKSQNCGSYLQAWALKTILERLGCEVCFVPYKSTSGSIVNIIWKVLKCCIKLRFRTAIFLINRKVMFNKAQRELPIINISENMDAYIFGSDTIWNFENPFFYSQKDFFIGKGITQPRYTYAVSGGSTSSMYYENDKNIKEELEKFDRISVRDGYLKGILEELFPKKQIVQVLDPTLLLTPSDYTSLISQSSSIKNYIFIYYFGNMPDKLFQQLLIFARKQGLKLVNMGFPDKRFDYNITNSPEGFIKYFISATYVITNTFHGCVFSVLFNKQFITDGFNKRKVEDFISRYGLQTQYITDETTVEEILTQSIDYKTINDRIEKEREISLHFLNEIVSTKGMRL